MPTADPSLLLDILVQDLSQALTDGLVDAVISYDCPESETVGAALAIAISQLPEEVRGWLILSLEAIHRDYPDGVPMLAEAKGAVKH